MTTTLRHSIATTSAKVPAKHKDGLLEIILKDIARLDDWLSGPPMTERDRLNRALQKTRFDRYIDLLR